MMSQDQNDGPTERDGIGLRLDHPDYLRIKAAKIYDAMPKDREGAINFLAEFFEIVVNKFDAAPY